MLVTFLGHACFYLQTGESQIIIDPYLSENPQAAAKPGDINVDWLLVTHGHQDHMSDAVEIAKQNKATIITTTEVARYCGIQGTKTHAMNIGGKYNFGNFTVKLTLAQHSSSVGTNPVEYLGQPCGFLIFSEGKTIYYAGDTGLFSDMELIGRLHPVDLAILPIGDNFTMGPEDAAEAVKLIKPARVVPMHYNTWDIISQDPLVFKTIVEKQAGVPVTILEPGATLEL